GQFQFEGTNRKGRRCGPLSQGRNDKWRNRPEKELRPSQVFVIEPLKLWTKSRRKQRLFPEQNNHCACVRLACLFRVVESHPRRRCGTSRPFSSWSDNSPACTGCGYPVRLVRKCCARR